MFCILYITKKVPIQMNWDLFVLLVLHTAYCLESKDVLWLKDLEIMNYCKIDLKCIKLYML